MLYRNDYAELSDVAKAFIRNFIFKRKGADDDTITTVIKLVLESAEGKDANIAAQIVRDEIDQKLKEKIFELAYDQVTWHKTLGHRTVLATTSPAEVAAPFTELLRMDDYISSIAEVDDNGLYRGTAKCIAYKEVKADLVAQYATTHGISLADSYAYSDSCSDRFLLDLVGHPRPTNADADLTAYALEKMSDPLCHADWEFVRFSPERSLVQRNWPVFAGAGAAVVSASVVAARQIARASR
jgi:HAD superfamily hydrolase (TIGR01490 family)